MELKVKMGEVVTDERQTPLTMENEPLNPHVNDDYNETSFSNQMSKRRIIKNFLVLAVGHCLVFTAFDSLSNLQSTMNMDQGMGVASQAVIYAFFTVSSFFLPTFIIRKAGNKATLVVSVIGLCPYVAANMYPSWEALLPAAVICGASFGPLWAARSTYVNEISADYAVHIRGSVDVVNAWFFGIYSFFHENAEIWGNVISYLVLKPANTSDYMPGNGTSSNCGSAFCDFRSHDANPNLEPPPAEKRLRLNLIYLALILIAAAIIKMFLDPLPKDESEGESQAPQYGLFIAAMKHLKNRDQILLLPLSFYCGLADGFYNSDFTKSYIACSMGISYVGFVTIAYGVVCAVMDCSSGWLVRWLTRAPVFLFAAIAHLVVWVTCLFWAPSFKSPTALFLVSGAYGLGASVWWAQIAALYGVHFKDNEEAAFSNFYFWSSLGLLLAYSYSDHLCTYVKLYILIALLLISMLGYLAVEKTGGRQRRG